MMVTYEVVFCSLKVSLRNSTENELYAETCISWSSHLAVSLFLETRQDMTAFCFVAVPQKSAFISPFRNIFGF